MPENELTDLQKKRAGPEALLVVCKACAENCFVPGRVSLGACSNPPITVLVDEPLAATLLRFAPPVDSPQGRLFLTTGCVPGVGQYSDTGVRVFFFFPCGNIL